MKLCAAPLPSCAWSWSAQACCHPCSLGLPREQLLISLHMYSVERQELCRVSRKTHAPQVLTRHGPAACQPSSDAARRAGAETAAQHNRLMHASCQRRDGRHENTVMCRCAERGLHQRAVCTLPQASMGGAVHLSAGNPSLGGRALKEWVGSRAVACRHTPSSAAPSDAADDGSNTCRAATVHLVLSTRPHSAPQRHASAELRCCRRYARPPPPQRARCRLCHHKGQASTVGCESADSHGPVECCRGATKRKA